mmetsp:Transcript_54733/g.130755  ORF Transcript_54733/g.130755 Transcript_54733/m.130755 type:complete len:206 (+) Transcript_54733:264-881(+)
MAASDAWTQAPAGFEAWSDEGTAARQSTAPSLGWFSTRTATDCMSGSAARSRSILPSTPEPSNVATQKSAPASCAVSIACRNLAKKAACSSLLTLPFFFFFCCFFSCLRSSPKRSRNAALGAAGSSESSTRRLSWINTSSEAFEVSSFATSESRRSASLIAISAASPVAAMMRRTPFEMPLSSKRAKDLASDVEEMCVPPQNSTD